MLRGAWLTVVVALVGCNGGSERAAGETDGPSSMGTAETADTEDAGTAGESGDADPEDTREPSEPFVPGPQVLPRLTQRQYRNAVTDLLGGPLPDVELEPDTNPYLFVSIGATNTSLSELGTQQYEEAAEALTQAVWADPARRDALLGCVPTAGDDACAQEYLARFGRRAFRRPLEDEELARWSIDAAGFALVRCHNRRARTIQESQGDGAVHLELRFHATQSTPLETCRNLFDKFPGT